MDLANAGIPGLLRRGDLVLLTARVVDGIIQHKAPTDAAVPSPCGPYSISPGGSRSRSGFAETSSPKGSG